jgi:hypothetical protein
VTSRRTCRGCGIPIAAGKGLVCGHFGTKRLHWDPCQGAWHKSCYRQKEADRFPIQSTRGQEEVDLEEEDGVAKEGDHFRVWRDGDHLLCPFQCDLCHFQNIQRRLPGSDPRDEFFGVCIRRANLDALWAREASTLESNRREGKHMRKAAATFGVNHQWDWVTGPYPVEDTWGMFEAACILLRSLDPGRNSKFIQHDTM